MKIRKTIFFLLVFQQGFGQNFDFRVLQKINLNRMESYDPSMQFLTNTSDFVAIGTPLTLLAVGYLKKDASIKKEGYHAAIATFGTYGMGYILKKAVNRPRPYITHPILQNYEAVTDGSFPSGSTALAFSAATSLSLSYPKWYVIGPSAIYACGVAYSRLHLGAHYPSDVLAGAVIGASSAYVSRQLNKLLINQYRKRKLKTTTF
jgi:membrane-associated phospholipid phosphatase